MIKIRRRSWSSKILIERDNGFDVRGNGQETFGSESILESGANCSRVNH